MPISTRVESIDRDLSLLLGDDLSPEGRSAALAAFARQANEDALRQNEAAIGRRPAVRRVVDGRVGAAEESVKPGGMIAYEYDLVADMLTYIGDLLVAHSPVLTGTYARSFLIMVDGAPHEPGAPLPPSAQDIVIVNTTPYARKVEGAPGRPPQSDQAPDGVFQAVAMLATSRFGNVAAIKFTWEGSGDSRTPALRIRLR
jgi:hypothetical protein